MTGISTPEEAKTPATRPPEGIHDKDEARVCSIVPDVCLTPCGNTMVAIPYNIYDLHGHDQKYTPTVRYRGFAAMVLRSNTTHVHGDEAGTGGGIVSGTHGGICEPIGHEPTVRCEGSPAIRDGDLCWMNNRNTIGKCVLVRDTSCNELPRPEPKPQIAEDGRDRFKRKPGESGSDYEKRLRDAIVQRPASAADIPRATRQLGDIRDGILSDPDYNAWRQNLDAGAYRNPVANGATNSYDPYKDYKIIPGPTRQDAWIPGASGVYDRMAADGLVWLRPVALPLSAV